MGMTAEQLQGFFQKAGIADDQAARLSALCAELAGRTARPDRTLVDGSLRRLALDYILPRLGTDETEVAPALAVPAPEVLAERDRMADLLLANYRTLLDGVMACGLYDLSKIATAAAKLTLAVATGEDMQAEMETRFDTALAGVPEALLDRTLAEVGAGLAAPIDGALGGYIIAATEASLGGTPLPEGMRLFVTSSVLFAWFHDVYPHGPAIIAAGDGASVGA